MLEFLFFFLGLDALISEGQQGGFSPSLLPPQMSLEPMAVRDAELRCLRETEPLLAGVFTVDVAIRGLGFHCARPSGHSRLFTNFAPLQSDVFIEIYFGGARRGQLVSSELCVSDSTVSGGGVSSILNPKFCTRKPPSSLGHVTSFSEIVFASS